MRRVGTPKHWGGYIPNKFECRYSHTILDLGAHNGFRLVERAEYFMKTDDSQLVLLKIEDKKEFEDSTTYIYAGTDPAAVHKPITVYKEKNASAYVVAGRYVGVTETHLKYKPLNEEERKVVVEKLGTGKIVKFLSNDQ
jgi:hypothetical protein